MSCFITVLFAYLIIQYVNAGCHDIYLLEEAKTRRVSRISPYGRITSAQGKCLDISNSDESDLTTNGQKVQIWDCVDSVPQQQWYLTSNNEIQNEAGHCLDIHQPAWENNELGSYVQIWECNGQDNQKWSIDGDTIKSTNGMCLDIGVDDVNTNGGVVQMWDCNGWDNQKWTLNGGTSSTPIASWGQTTNIGSSTVFESAKWNECPDGYVIAGFYKNDCEDIWCIEEILCATPDPSISQTCYDKDIKISFDSDATVTCNDGYFIRGIYSSSYETGICRGLSCLETLRCCKWDENEIELDGDEGTQDWWGCFDAEHQGWCEVDNGEYVTGLYRNEIDYASRFAPLLKVDSAAGSYGYPMNPDTYISQKSKFGDDGYTHTCDVDCPPSPCFDCDCDIDCHYEYNENTVLNTNNNPTYYRQRECDGSTIKVGYWWFYGYQHDCFFGAGAHAGDWEKIIAHIDKFECKVEKVTFHQHGGHYTLSDDQFYKDGDRPIVYVGKIAHGSYYDSNNFGGGCGYFYDYRDDDDSGDWLWTDRNLINMDTSNDAWIVNKEDICCSNPHTYDTCSDGGSDGCDDCGCFWESCDEHGELFVPIDQCTGLNC